MDNLDISEAKDYIEDRLYPYELLGNANNLEEFIINDDNEFQNQYLEGYKCGCVFYSSSMNDNYCNTRDGLEEKTKGKDLCDYALKKGIRNNEVGSYIINGPKTLKELKYISGYAKVETLDEAKKALSEKRLIHCGSNMISWRDTKKNNIAQIKSGSPGHCFHIIGYNDGEERKEGNRTIPKGGLICKDSSNSFDNGRFYIKYDDYKYLFNTKIVFINNVEVLTIKKAIMDKINIAEAKAGFELGLRNGQRAEEPITREEAVTVIVRALKKIDDKLGIEELIKKFL